jgi:cytidyltransferase-like protein
MSVVFNDYISKNASRYVGVNFDNAEFSNSESFKLNTNFIKNEKTLTHVSNEVLASLFKITIGTFRKQRNKASDIINDDMVLQLNTVVDKINEVIFVENTDENSIYDYNNFMMHSKIKSSMHLNEALTVKHGEQGKQPVNMFVGRFQPFTLGHAKVLEAIHKENGYPVIVFLIKAKTIKKGDDFRKPYSEDLQVQMFKQVQKQYKFLKEIIVLDRAAIDYMFNAMRPKYEPVLWGTGTDRMKSYGYQVNNDSYRDQLNSRSDFGLFEIPRTDDNISATEVRNALLDGDEKTFKKMTPKAIHKMYDTLKSEIEKSMNLVPESTELENSLMTYEQFINNQDI